MSDPEGNPKAKSLAVDQIFRPSGAIAEDAANEEIATVTMFMKPKHVNIRKVINRFRSTKRPDEPIQLDFVIDTEFLKCQDFLIGDINTEGRRHLIFATQFQLTLLKQATRWFIDGTFKVVGQSFKPNGQLMTINVIVQSDGARKQFPVAFVLMSRRRKTDYVEVLELIKEKIGEVEVESFVLDFESGWYFLLSIFGNCIIISLFIVIMTMIIVTV